MTNNGPLDQGTIVDILLDKYPFVVKWDKQHPSQYEERRLVLPKLDIDATILVNLADENIDQFSGDQLVEIPSGTPA